MWLGRTYRSVVLEQDLVVAVQWHENQESRTLVEDTDPFPALGSLAADVNDVA